MGTRHASTPPPPPRPRHPPRTAYDIPAYIAQSVADNAKIIGIDTSPDYGSQPAIGAAMVASGLPRSRFFITSKVNMENAVAPGGEAAFMKTIQDLVLTPLGVTYVDLLVLHHAGRKITDKVRRALVVARAAALRVECERIPRPKSLSPPRRAGRAPRMLQCVDGGPRGQWHVLHLPHRLVPGPHGRVQGGHDA